jgi:S-adenosylmethionine-diacylglycerol 3-amino-3-carboxypropyl transferase
MKRPHTQTGKRQMKKITFARYMENAEIDLQLFKRVKQKRAVTITSGGCIALTLALNDPEIIYAIDKNPHQNYLLELKIAAIESLDYTDYKSLMLGTTENDHTLYRSCRDRLSQPAREFWDQNRNRIKKGLLFCGITEKVAFMFGKSISVLMGRKKVNKLFEITDPAELQTFYDSQWNTTFWNLV